MVKRTTADETRVWLKDYFRRQADIGLGKAVVNLACKPRNPFEPEKRRLPRREFVFGAGMFLSALAWFFYFSFAR
jgi:hypothetical protein